MRSHGFSGIFQSSMPSYQSYISYPHSNFSMGNWGKIYIVGLSASHDLSNHVLNCGTPYQEQKLLQGPKHHYNIILAIINLLDYAVIVSGVDQG